MNGLGNYVLQPAMPSSHPAHLYAEWQKKKLIRPQPIFHISYWLLRRLDWWPRV